MGNRRNRNNDKGGKQLLGHMYSRSALPYLAMAIILVFIIIAEGREIKYHIDMIERWINHLGVWGVLAFVCFYVAATSLLLPDTVLAILAGSLFGVVTGFTAVLTGTLLASSLQFLLSRHLLKSKIQRVLAKKPVLAAIQKAVNHHAFRLQVLLRLAPLNPATISYLLGAAGVRFSGFILACLSLVPALFMEVYFGHAGKHIARMAGRDSGAVYMHDLLIIGSLIACVAVVFVISKTAYKAISEAVYETGDV